MNILSPQSSVLSKKIAILISGRGSNLTALADAIAAGQLQAEIALVISNVADAEGLHKAAARGIPTLVIPHKGLTRTEHAAQLLAALTPLNLSLVCLAGYMRLLAPEFTQALRNRVVNIHPSLLPAFPGLHAQRQAVEYGVRFSGCTVHLVDEELDHGPIVAQAVVPVFPTDTEETLSSRIL
ncbi:MAG: phosphoribosylglycinamide formyltransferase, partial [Blastocatellia bacterium]|nr:phosphoribosylglycinamide formyltransferase [Blastocatellia bacterium]